MRKNTKIPLAILIALLTCVCVASADERPSDLVGRFNASLLQAMKRADNLGYKGRFELLDPAVKRTFALSFMAGQTTGRYWKQFSASQKETFLRTYTEWTIATYAGRFDGYSGEKFVVVSETPVSQGTTSVISRLVQPNGEVIEFNYLLRKSGDHWRVVDIRISGVSQLALTRSQFTAVLKDKGFEGLISMLKEKIRKLSS